LSYLLDTNAVIALLNDQPAIFRKRLRRAVSNGAEIRAQLELHGAPGPMITGGRAENVVMSIKSYFVAS
jgi:hypothetical protein